MTQDNSPPADDLALIIGLCTQFERSWRQGNPLRIESLLSEVPSELHPRLLEDLIGLEIRLRSASVEQPGPEEYRGRFPEYQIEVDAAFYKAVPRTTGFEQAMPRVGAGRDCQVDQTISYVEIRAKSDAEAHRPLT